MFVPCTVLPFLLAASVGAHNCVSSNAVHILIARGTNEPPGPGVQAIIANAIVRKLPGSHTENVVYPATYDLPASANAGVANMTAQASAYHTRCPRSSMVFMGFSQGAQITGDVIAGGGSTTPTGVKTNHTQPLSSVVMSKVISIILFGDPNRLSNQTYYKGTCRVDSKNPRVGSQATNFDSYGPRIQDYCDKADPICCRTGNDLPAHFGYFTDKNAQDVANFVAERLAASNCVQDHEEAREQYQLMLPQHCSSRLH